MTLEPQLQQPPEFLWRRTLDGPPAWSVWVPVAFAMLVIYLIGLFRQERKSPTSILFPVFVIVLGLAAWAGASLRDRFNYDFSWDVVAPVGVGFCALYLLAMFATSVRLRGMLPAFIAVAVLGAGYALAGQRVFLTLFSWWYLLAPTLLIALFYVGMMYLRDARSVPAPVAGFLGFLRCIVYLVLATVFLLPGCQTFDTTEHNAKALLLLDVSGSMETKDDIAEPGQDQAKMPTRQDKVIRFLAEGKKDSKPFFDLALPVTPITAFRFGSMLDESEILSFSAAKPATADALRAWLKPDKANYVPEQGLTPEKQDERRRRYEETIDSLRAGTNIGGSALQLAKLEGNNYVQMLVIVSDGQNNLGSEDAIREFVNRFSSGKWKVPIVTVGVGEYRLPASIRIDDIQAPESARPDDKFPVRVPVVGSGLTGEEFTVTLEAKRIKDALGQPIADSKTYQFGPKKGKFQGAGDFQTDSVEFDIDVQELVGKTVSDDKDGALEGTWQFVAKVPRHAREAFPKAEHVSEPPTEVLVQKRKLRVLLFAGGPTREYQFLRTLLYREVSEKRLDMSIYLQTGKDEQHVDQDVEAERFLRNFPNKVGPSDAGAKYMSLSDYDVIIAIDPDWLALDTNQYKMIRDWVDKDSGGLVFVAGPVHTFQLARPAGVDISALKTLLPVFLNDSRLHGLGGIGHDTTRPYILNFTPAAKLFDFLKLDEAEDSPTGGWNKFFWEGGVVPPNVKDAKPKRGIYNYYPVDKIKPASTVIATFAGPDSSKINDGKDEQPFMVEMRFGSGKTLYIGAAELWRLRQAKDTYHERFWIKLARYMSAGTTQQKKYGRILLGRTAPVGNIAFEAQIKGKNLLPLPADERPTVYVKRLNAADGPPKRDQSFDLKAKQTQGEHSGWFVGNFEIREPGEYEFRIPISGTSESLTHRLTVRKPDPEKDNVRNNFSLLYQIASEAKETLDPLPPETRKRILNLLQPVEGDQPKDSKQAPRLFFRLDQADSIADILRPLAPKREQVKGKLHDLWDQGAKSNWQPSAYHLAWATPLIVGLLGMAILLIFGQYLFAGLFMAAGAAIAAMPVIYDLMFHPAWQSVPVNFSYVLIVVVTLLGLEWLMRKLLKLA